MELHPENRSSESTPPTLEELYDSAEFSESPYIEKLRQIAELVSKDCGYDLEEVAEYKADKDWGGYITLERNEHGAEKILIVRPMPQEIPEHWDWDGPYAQMLSAALGNKGVALSFQRHTDGRREDWTILDGEGYYLTSDSKISTLDPHLIQVEPVVANTRHNVVSHLGTKWHTVVNVSLHKFLVIRESIVIPPESEKHFDETNIERSGDLFKRAGISDNI